jgi:hypothetical protein
MAAGNLTRAITLILSLFFVCAALFAIVLNNLSLAVLAVVSLLFLVTTVFGYGRIAVKCSDLTGRAGTLHLWGASPPLTGSADIVVKRVWALGAGLHFQVVASRVASPVHIKVAQPRDWSVGPDALSIADAKYVQVRGATIKRVPGCLALQFVLDPPSHPTKSLVATSGA